MEITLPLIYPKAGRSLNRGSGPLTLGVSGPELQLTPSLLHTGGVVTMSQRVADEDAVAHKDAVADEDASAVNLLVPGD